MPALSLLVLIVGLRIVAFKSYPFAMPDEGFWASGPKNFVVFGSPLMDGRLHSFLSPATFALLSCWFWVAGPSLVSARLFSVSAGLLSCALMAVIGRRFVPQRAWLVPLLYGVSALAVIVDRTILLESHQTFWLLLAATLWLGECRSSAAAAGAAFGLAVLVKSNSLYLLPAFCLSVPAGRAVTASGPLMRFPLIWFSSAAAAVAGSGYLAAWAIDPQDFQSAFRYEIEGVQFVNQHVLFHYKRLGLNPHLLGITAREVLFTDPFLCLVGVAGMLAILARFGASTRAQRLFASWVVCGLLVNVFQIYPQYRYVTTTTPALAYLTAWLLAQCLGPEATGRGGRKTLFAALLFGFIAYQTIEIGLEVYRRPNRSYWKTVEWLRANVPPQASLLAAPYLGISLPHRSYDFYRLIYGYDGSRRPLEDVVADHSISWIVADSQWGKHQYRNADMKRFLATHCVVKATIDSFNVLACGDAR